MTIQTTTHKAEAQSKTRRSLLFGLGVGVAMAGVMPQADAASPEKIVFVSERI